MRDSKAYGRIKAVNGVMFIALGAAILYQMAHIAATAGFAAVPGLILGAAMLGLGVHRTLLVLRGQK